MHGYNGFGGYGPATFGFPWPMLIGWGLALLAIGFATFAIVRALKRSDSRLAGGLRESSTVPGRGTGGGTDLSRAVERLAERFAEGEITKEQFVEMRDLIESKS
ncbi:MAG: SHOCT domain-containing protein [Spirochaetaceae bacterium]|nr:SHOCT domain-containing protein [Spirochaetaceae bacterium]